MFEADNQSLPKTMWAARVHQAGGPEQLRLERLPLPQVREGWTLVKVKAFGLNHSEIFTRQGLSASVRFPRVLGIEMVGEVCQSTDAQLIQGQSVVSLMGEMGRDFDGSYAEYVLVPNHQLYPIERRWEWTDFAAIPETYYTAYGSMEALNVQPQDCLLVRAAASGVGLAFLKLLKARNPNQRVVGSVRSWEKAGLLDGQGYDALILDQVGKLATRETFDKILDLVGPAHIEDSIGHLRPRGIICSTGQLGGQWYLRDFDPIMALRHQVYLTGFYSGDVTLEGLTALFDYMETHDVQVRPDRVFTLQDIVQAHRYLEDRRGWGKVVIETEG